MRKFFVLLMREIRSYFYSPIAYIVLVFFLLVSGVDFYFQISFMNQRAVGYSVQEAFFNSVFFWFAFVLIFPLITMRLFAEEFKLGTIEPLMTAPVRDWQVILSKFFGALFFYMVLWIPTPCLLRHLHRGDAQAGGELTGRICRLLSDAAYARDVLSVGRLLRLGPDEEPDHCRGHFILRDHALFLPGPGPVHPARCQRGHPGIVGVFFSARAYGNVIARGHRYAPNRALPQYDGLDADVYVSSLSIAEVEDVSRG